MNDPYKGGSHLPDVTVITPLFYQNELIMFTANRAHHAEIGGKTPGSMPPFSTSLLEEGVLLSNVKLIDAGVQNYEHLKDLLANSKYPTRALQDNLSDISAQVAANQKGVNDLITLIGKWGLETVLAYMKFIQQAAEIKMRQALLKLPDKNYEFVDYLDNGTPIQVKIIKRQDSAIIDFTGTGQFSKNTNFNANKAITFSAVMYVMRCLINEEIPLNQGVLKPIQIIIPEECVLNPNAEELPAIVAGNTEVSTRIVDTLLGALELCAASQGTMNNIVFGNANFGYYETVCGGSGATPHSNGVDTVQTHMTNTRITDPEVIELRYPVRILKFQVRKDSGGKGKYKGGNGTTREILFLTDLTVSTLCQRRKEYAPYGLQGGEQGQKGINILIQSNKEPIILEGQTMVEVHSGDILQINTPGGGGFGQQQ